MKPPLRLRAAAPADYDLLAACVQDALMPVSEMAWLRRARRFVAVFDRFSWESAWGRGAAAGGRTPAPRPRFVVQSAIRFEGVGAARARALDLRPGGAPLELLTLSPGRRSVSLLFAGGGAIRLEGEGIEAWLEDIGPPRPATASPRHDEGEAPA